MDGFRPASGANSATAGFESFAGGPVIHTPTVSSPFSVMKSAAGLDRTAETECTSEYVEYVGLSLEECHAACLQRELPAEIPSLRSLCAKSAHVHSAYSKCRAFPVPS